MFVSNPLAMHLQVQQEQQEDTLAQLQGELQEQLQHQLSNSSLLSAAANNTDITSAADASAAADTTLREAADAAVAAAVEAAVDAVLAGAADCEPVAAASAEGATAPGTCDVAAPRASSVASGGSGDDEWHLVSPGGSVRMNSSSGRYSFEYAGAGNWAVAPHMPCLVRSPLQSSCFVLLRNQA